MHEVHSPIPVQRRGSKWLGICMLSLFGGTVLIGVGGPGFIPGFTVVLALTSLVLGIYSLSRVGILAIGVSAVVLLCGVIAAIRNFRVTCIGDCPYSYNQATVLLGVILPSAIAVAVGCRALGHSADGSLPTEPGRRAVFSLLLGLTFWLPFALGIWVNLDMSSGLSLVATILMFVASLAGLSLGMDTMGSPNRRLGMVGVVFNIIGLVWASMLLPTNVYAILTGHLYSGRTFR